MSTDHSQRNTAIMYQFQLDGRPAGQAHDTWELAAMDAVAAGYAKWKNPHELFIDQTQGAWIQRIRL